MQRPNMRLVPVKSEDQQARLMVHRARQGFVIECTACINRIRGLLRAGFLQPAEIRRLHDYVRLLADHVN